MWSLPGPGDCGCEVGFASTGPPVAAQPVQSTTSRFICPNASDLPHGTVGKPLATRQELFSRTPLQPAKTGLLDGRAVIYSNPVDVMPERTYGTERYSAGQWEDRNRREEVSGSAPQIPSGPNGPWDLDPPFAGPSKRPSTLILPWEIVKCPVESTLPEALAGFILGEAYD